MTSTVLDGVLCLLLISAAVVTVTTATPHEPAGAGRADDVASTLATTTATVNYTLASPGTGDGVSTSGGRTAHGTLAELLARAAIARASVGGQQLSHARDGLVRRVEQTVGAAVRANHTRVTAAWRPYPGASIGGRVAVGATPPPNVPVHAATLTVPSGFPSRRASARSAAGVDGVADAVAAGIVEGLFPPTRTRIAAGSPPPTSRLVRRRYHRAERLFGVAPPAVLADGGVDATNDRLAGAVSERVARDLHSTNTSARRVAGRVRLDSVRIVVRTWP